MATDPIVIHGYGSWSCEILVGDHPNAMSLRVWINIVVDYKCWNEIVDYKCKFDQDVAYKHHIRVIVN